MAEARDGTLGGCAEGAGERDSPVRLLVVESGLPVSGVGEFRHARVGSAGRTGETRFLRTWETGRGNTLIAGAGEA